MKKYVFKGKGSRFCTALLAVVLLWTGLFSTFADAAETMASASGTALTAPQVTGNQWKTSQDMGRRGAVQKVPILLYHNICRDANSSAISQNTISQKQFESHMKALVAMGCSAVTFDEMIAYVEKGTPLPKKPVCITFDDGYLSNYQIAFPILKKYKLKATVFVIGVSVGSKEYYKDTKFPITPHFDWIEAKAMSDSGIFSIQTHTYDMHQWEKYETGDQIRDNVLRLPGESDEEYRQALTGDVTRAKEEIEKACGKPVQVLAYPGGVCDGESQKLISSCGIKATLTIESGTASLIRGVPKSLQRMNRYYVTPQTTETVLRKWIG